MPALANRPTVRRAKVEPCFLHRFISVSARVGGVRSVVITYISVYVC